MRRLLRSAAPLLALAVAVPAFLLSQGPQGADGQGKGKGKGKGGDAVTPRAQAPVDLTGYWVPLITEDWLYRQVTPQKGDVASVPVSPAGRTAAEAWDPAKDEAAGEQCKAYGAAGVMRLPGRIHIDWQDENNLKIDFEYGTQTRTLHFAGAPPSSGDAGYQGYSIATWDGLAPAGRGGRGGGKEAPAPAVKSGALKVVTTRLKPGYLRKNGVPYGANTTLTEYFDTVGEPNGDRLLIVKQIVDDPEFLQQPFVTSTHFKKEADGSAWKPSPCSAK